MPATLILARERQYHNSVVALLGYLERSGVIGRCDVRLVPWKDVVAEYEQAKTAGQPCVVGFSLQTRDVERFSALAKVLRSILAPEDFLVAGGPHATACDEQVLRLGANVVFRGEAERSFAHFVRAVTERRDWRNVGGISFTQGGSVVRTRRWRAVEIDSVCSTCQRLGLLAPLELTRGCPYGCRFCQTPRLWGRKVRHRSLQSVLDQLRRYRAFVRFLSPNAFGYMAERPGRPNLRAIVTLLESIRERWPDLQVNFGIFPGEVRPEYVTRELVRAIRPLVANRYIAIGGQSGSDRVLMLARRGHTVADILRAAESTLDEGMGVLLDILFGLPGETADDLRQTILLMERLERWGVRFRVHLFSPIPGTPFAGQRPAPPLDDETALFLEHLERRGKIEGLWRSDSAQRR